MDKQPVVKLIGNDGNAFSIIGACRKAAEKAKWPKEKIDAVIKEMMAGSYDHLLCVAMEHFDVR